MLAGFGPSANQPGPDLVGWPAIMCQDLSDIPVRMIAPWPTKCALLAGGLVGFLVRLGVLSIDGYLSGAEDPAAVGEPGPLYR